MALVDVRVLATVFLLEGIAFAGCFGGPTNKTDDGDVQAPASPAEVSEDKGGIEGVIVDDAQNIIAGAEVGIPALELTTISDIDGRFSFSRIEPGSHRVLAARLGYEPGDILVDVVAGEVAAAQLTLIPIAAHVPFKIYQQQNGLFGCGMSVRPVVGVAVCGVFSLFLNDTSYDKFLLVWEVERPTVDWQTSVFEMEWDSTQALGQGLAMIWEILDCPNDRPFRFAREEGHSPLYAMVNRSAIETILENTLDPDEQEECEEAGTDCEQTECTNARGNCDDTHCTIMSRVFSSADTLGSSSPADIGVTWQQQYATYHTAFFNEPAEEGYTALETGG